MTAAPKASVIRGIRKRKLLLEHEQEAKKQRVTEVTMVAMDVMNHLLAPTGDVGYDVADEEWERLVQLTQQNEKFQRLFNFPDDAPGWVTTKAKKKKTHLKIVALDCEMCVTASDFTSERFASALCRVSAVNGENILRGIISDFIVHQPEEGMHMVDPKTDIHGITLQQITDSKISLVKAQKKMLKYINKDTIVVGHSVHGDLASMQINHRRVIDTALIFRRNTGDQSRATPGLKDLTKFLLGFEMPTADKSVVAPAKKITEVMIARSCRLRVHRIPKGVTSRDIEKFFLQSANIVPSAVEQIVWLKNQNRGSCNVTFATNAHAALAFESSVISKGKVTKDSIGRPQKAIAVVNDKGTTFKNVTLGIL
ncbi:hypothetical protein BBO99_00001267 [Phytophthora kernoviae]|uniref:Exonuclease domain-containing protein n=2 Tax=Phytophthora kernoviae TaxID=325452 RepID=A0A421H0B3_9STRA|nr:hypothetical protein G195_006408 [Phytophthora kernoviae 00238/432]KAG2531565.1 hypothetical protein JM16_001050 [Phytophthora kernoviae]KAG2532475.1 hypothetical protein JM18_001132 [Phytophthora kernoviae]RLN44277.1 hypothetical protein BBI17_001122 [Phytophthora kernoviae]RLN84507.1 hypothetical protein BBO99_00001267 [Phytophthora kernoviae]